MLRDHFRSLKKEFADLELTLAETGSCDEAFHAAVANTSLPGLRFPRDLQAEQAHSEIARADLGVCLTMSSFPEGLALARFIKEFEAVTNLPAGVI